MSGATVPYRLRPHKAVDRRLFLELLARFERWRPLDRHAYVSMAGYTMEDQKLVHRLLGITRLIAFDFDEATSRRQHFNRPIDGAKCRKAKSGDVASDIVAFASAAGIPDAGGYVVWLDYTIPSAFRSQVDEFGSLIAQLAAGDIVRVTVNAARASWRGERRRDEVQPTKQELRERMFEELRTRLGDLLADDVEPSQLDDAGLAAALARAFEIMASRRIRGSSALVAEPLSLVRYADGQQMLAITVAIVAKTDVAAMRTRLQLDEWHFGSRDWRDVKSIVVPDLTMRERLFLERSTELTTAQIAAEAGFDFDEATVPGFLDNFRSYYRHYPALSPVEL